MMHALADLAASLVVPPVSLALLALLLWRHRLAPMALCALLALAVPFVADSLLASLGANAASCHAPGAIVVLGADVAPDAAGGDTEPGPLTLERLRAAARLARRTGLPLLAAGGIVQPGAAPVAAAMAHSLRDDFSAPARWVEADSADTWANAANAAHLLPADTRCVFVVTHAWHMRRAGIAFRHAGLGVVPAPVRVDPAPVLDVVALLPRASAWQRSFHALHEWIGCAWFALRT